MDNVQVIPTDDQVTELSSPPGSSGYYGTSTPTRQLRNEADKQILEWASKLELESIELRDKSSALLKNLNDKYVNLNNIVNKFETIEQSSFLLK